ncbi:MAG TPA: hypothetical protein PKC97_09470 [Burkholderiaceae bacterium]|nr:hypothetical protein [Burkholderiaceae bacterium]
MNNRSALGAALCTALLGAAGTAAAQNQVVKPPVAQAWIDVATFSGMGMPGMGGAGGVNPMAMMGAMMGGGGGAANARNAFGNTQTAAAGRWVDVTLYTSRNPALAEATQAVPAGTQLAPSLKLVAPQAAPGKPPTDDDAVEERDYERPKGKIYLYWGCGDTVRAGQPRVLDVSTASAQDFQKFFVSRRATKRGAHSAAGRPSWPNPTDARMVPDNASLVGENAFSGQGVPENFKFAIGAAQDLMPAIQLRQTDAGGATMLAWNALPTARAYFIAAMGAKEGAQNEMVLWTSSEQPDTGMGLVDYQTNPAVDRWLKEGVLLAPGVTHCAVPKGIFGDGGAAMLRMIAYGSELNLAHPPRPSDPKIAWAPDWAVKIRVKSVASAMLGMDMNAMTMPGAGNRATPSNDAPPPPQKQEDSNPLNPANLLKGIFGR